MWLEIHVNLKLVGQAIYLLTIALGLTLYAWGLQLLVFLWRKLEPKPVELHGQQRERKW